MIEEAPGQIALVCNPLSGGLRKRLPQLRALCAGVPGFISHDAASVPEFYAAAEALADKNVSTLLIAGGDGTVHGMLSAILGPGLRGWRPRLGIVPCGTTNMTAADLQIRGNAFDVLRGLLDGAAGLRPLRILSRPALCIEQPGGASLHGMFFGCGLIAAGVRYFSSRIKPAGIRGEAASAIVVAKFLGKLFTRDTVTIAARVDGGALSGADDYIVILATTLERLLLGMRPYWGTESAAIHATAMTRRPRWHRLPSMLYGGGRATDDGCTSANLDRMTLEMDGEFIVDGELYAATGAGALGISASAPVEFIVP